MTAPEDMRYTVNAKGMRFSHGVCQNRLYGNYKLMTSVMILIAGALAFFVALREGERICY